MASSVTALLELELPTPSELASKLNAHSLASLVVALTVELRKARAQASEAEQLAGRLTTLAGTMLTQQASKQQQPAPHEASHAALGAQAAGAPQAALGAQAIAVPGAAKPGQAENWAWSTGHEQRASSREKRSRSRQRRRRSRSNRRERDKEKAGGKEKEKEKEQERTPEREARERDRAFVKDRARRAQAEAHREPAKLGADVEHSWGKYRASCTFMGERGPVTSVGPWRKSSDKALEDAEEFQEAYRKGGDAEVQKCKVALLRRATAEGGFEENNEPASSGVQPDPNGEFLYPTEIEGPSKTSSTLGGYRACVTFPNSAKPTYEGAKPRKPIPVKCPWRLGPRARAAAEADARALCEAYEAQGETGMQEKKRDMFKTADADAKAARMGRGKDDTLQNIFQKSSSSSTPADKEVEDKKNAAQQRERLEHTLEEDKNRGPESRGLRAKCCFPSDRPNPSGGPSAPIQISGPWRKRRSEAEADVQELQGAYEEGGLSAANARRMALLREREEGPQSEQPPKGELAEEDLAKRYGKGFALAASMGFAAGSGLGREGRGLRTPVEAVDAEVALATASRHIGLGFADAVGTGAAPNVD